MSSGYNIGDMVKWKWGKGWGRGQVEERFTKKATRTIDGAETTRHASDNEPAYLIKQDDGGQVLKSHSEVHKDR